MTVKHITWLVVDAALVVLAFAAAESGGRAWASDDGFTGLVRLAAALWCLWTVATRTPFLRPAAAPAPAGGR